MLPVLDRQAEAWREHRSRACRMADLEGTLDAERLDRAVWCLDERRMALAALVTELSHADAMVARKAVTAATGLPSASPCLDAQVLAALPDDETLYDLSELFRVFGDSTRIKILYVLFESELCVCDIARLLNLTQSAVSHQLRILKASNLVRFRREGKTVFYALDDDHVRSVLALGMEHVLEK